MSSRLPTTVEMSLEEFSRHGGLSGPHKDGWGLAWYDERDLRLVKEAFPAADSACVRFVQSHPPRSPFVLSHIRKATHGAVATRNCQPFVRELGGAWHCFAHNGHLAGIDQLPQYRPQAFRPVGETDSERAFCALLERMRALWLADDPPALEARLAVLARFAGELRALGPANFLYCDGDALFAHADRRTQADGGIRAPGLWRLARHCALGRGVAAEGMRIAPADGLLEVELLASVPLSGEQWVPLPEGSVHAVRHGALAAVA